MLTAVEVELTATAILVLLWIKLQLVFAIAVAFARMCFTLVIRKSKAYYREGCQFLHACAVFDIFPLTVMLLAMDDKSTKIFYARGHMSNVNILCWDKKKKKKGCFEKHVVLVLELVPFLGSIIIIIILRRSFIQTHS